MPDQPRSLRAARSVPLGAMLLSVPMRPLSVDGVVVEFGVVVDVVPLLEPMLPVLGAVVSVLGDVVLGDVLLGDVVLGVCVVGDCVPGDVALGVLELESVLLVCAYTRPAATARATLAPAAIELNLLMENSCLEVNGNLPMCLGFRRPSRGNPHAHRCAHASRTSGGKRFNVYAWASRRRAGRSRIPSSGCTASSS
jgi:hypothetical protein